MNIYDLLITTMTVAGTVKIVGINIMVLGAVLIPVIQFLVKVIKKYLPKIEQKAWVPLTLGIVAFLAAGLSTGQINSISTFITYIVGGIASGGIASSVRDIFVGK